MIQSVLTAGICITSLQRIFDNYWSKMVSTSNLLTDSAVTEEHGSTD